MERTYCKTCLRPTSREAFLWRHLNQTKPGRPPINCFLQEQGVELLTKGIFNGFYTKLLDASGCCLTRQPSHKFSFSPMQISCSAGWEDSKRNWNLSWTCHLSHQQRQNLIELALAHIGRHWLASVQFFFSSCGSWTLWWRLQLYAKEWHPPLGCPKSGTANNLLTKLVLLWRGNMKHHETIFRDSKRRTTSTFTSIQTHPHPNNFLWATNLNMGKQSKVATDFSSVNPAKGTVPKSHSCSACKSCSNNL